MPFTKENIFTQQGIYTPPAIQGKGRQKLAKAIGFNPETMERTTWGKILDYGLPGLTLAAPLVEELAVPEGSRADLMLEAQRKERMGRALTTESIGAGIAVGLLTGSPQAGMATYQATQTLGTAGIGLIPEAEKSAGQLEAEIEAKKQGETTYYNPKYGEPQPTLFYKYGGKIPYYDKKLSMKKGGHLSVEKAKEILRHGKIGGKSLTEKQKKFFGFIAGGGTPTRAQAGGMAYGPSHEEGGINVNMEGGELIIPENLAEKVIEESQTAQMVSNRSLQFSDIGLVAKRGGVKAPSEYEELLRKYFTEEEILMALKIMELESGYKPTAINKNKDGSIDYGIMQINSRHIKRLKELGIINTEKDLFNPETNIKAAKAIFDEREKFAKADSGWEAWSTYAKAKTSIDTIKAPIEPAETPAEPEIEPTEPAVEKDEQKKLSLEFQKAQLQRQSALNNINKQKKEGKISEEQYKKAIKELGEAYPKSFLKEEIFLNEPMEYGKTATSKERRIKIDKKSIENYQNIINKYLPEPTEAEKEGIAGLGTEEAPFELPEVTIEGKKAEKVGIAGLDTKEAFLTEEGEGKTEEGVAAETAVAAEPSVALRTGKEGQFIGPPTGPSELYKGEEGVKGGDLSDYLPYIIAGSQFATGLAGALRAEEPPGYEISPEYIKYKERLEGLSRTGLTPAQRALAERKLERGFTLGRQAIEAKAPHKGEYLANVGELATQQYYAGLELENLETQAQRSYLTMYGNALSNYETLRRYQNEIDRQDAMRKEEVAGNLMATGARNMTDFMYYNKLFKSLKSDT